MIRYEWVRTASTCKNVSLQVLIPCERVPAIGAEDHAGDVLSCAVEKTTALYAKTRQDEDRRLG